MGYETLFLDRRFMDSPFPEWLLAGPLFNVEPLPLDGERVLLGEGR